MAETLKSLREAQGLTAKEVANELGVSVTAVYNYESGIREISVEQVLILSELYKKSAETIIRAQLNSRKRFVIVQL